MKKRKENEKPEENNKTRKNEKRKKTNKKYPPRRVNGPSVAPTRAELSSAPLTGGA
jgi:hypothetical protein